VRPQTPRRGVWAPFQVPACPFYRLLVAALCTGWYKCATRWFHEFCTQETSTFCKTPCMMQQLGLLLRQREKKSLSAGPSVLRHAAFESIVSVYMCSG
jgi:hypothetical protein